MRSKLRFSVSVRPKQDRDGDDIITLSEIHNDMRRRIQTKVFSPAHLPADIHFIIQDVVSEAS